MPIIEGASAKIDYEKFNLTWPGLELETPIIFVPGLGCTWQVWSAVVLKVMKSRQVFVVNTRGAGSSVPKAESWTFEDMAGDILELMDAEEIDKAVLVGLSLGGALCLQATLIAPERIAGIVTYGAPTPGLPMISGPLDVWNKYTIEEIGIVAGLSSVREVAERRMAQAVNSDECKQALVDMIAQMKPAYYRAQAAALASAKAVEKLDQILVPVAVMQGSEDKTIFPEVGRFISETVQVSQYIELKDWLHFGNLDHRSEFSNELLKALDWLKDMSNG